MVKRFGGQEARRRTYFEVEGNRPQEPCASCDFNGECPVKGDPEQAALCRGEKGKAARRGEGK